MEEYKMNEELLVNSPIDASEFEHIGQDLGSLNEMRLVVSKEIKLQLHLYVHWLLLLF